MPEKSLMERIEEWNDSFDASRYVMAGDACDEDILLLIDTIAAYQSAIIALEAAMKGRLADSTKIGHLRGLLIGMDRYVSAFGPKNESQRLHAIIEEATK